MQAFQFIISGEWAHFKKPETNNNPLTYDFMPKTALLGLIGAVIGLERETMKEQFPILSEDLLFGLQLLTPVKKTSWGFTSKTAVAPVAEGTPKYFEFLREPKYVITLALKNERSAEIYNRFKTSVKEELAVYTPVLGWHNLPADLQWKSEGRLETHSGEFSTKGFVTTGDHSFKEESMSIRLENIPTWQNDDFWNLPEKFIDVAYPDQCGELFAKGLFYSYICTDGTESLCLV